MAVEFEIILTARCIGLATELPGMLEGANGLIPHLNFAGHQSTNSMVCLLLILEIAC